MPSSDTGSYAEHQDEDVKETKKGKKGKKEEKEEKKEEEESDQEEKDTKKDKHDDDDDDMEQTSGARGYDDGEQGTNVITKTLHALMLIILSTSFICLLAIIPSRSLGTAQNVSVGAWEVCYGDVCKAELGCGTETNQMITGVFGIIAIIQIFIMLVFQILEFTKPGRFGFFAKLQCVLCHLLWLWLLVSWACWASVRDTWHGDCAVGDEGHFYYAWGFVFLVGMWCTHFLLAIVMTMKAMGKRVCGL